jgi:dynein heavy chain, axonemal
MKNKRRLALGLKKL